MVYCVAVGEFSQDDVPAVTNVTENQPDWDVEDDIAHHPDKQLCVKRPDVATLSSTPATEISLLKLRLLQGASEIVLDNVVKIVEREFAQLESELIESAQCELDPVRRLVKMEEVFARAYRRVGQVGTRYGRRLWLEANLGPSVRHRIVCVCVCV
mgnify:CR=1 FL=1